jgi:type IV secretory pathway VirB2 component (pilin)
MSRHLSRRLAQNMAPFVTLALTLALPALAFAKGRLNGTLTSTNTELRAFIEGDFANLAVYVGLAAAAFTMIVRRGQGFGWAMIIFAVGIVLKNVGWVMDTITDLSGNLR